MALIGLSSLADPPAGGPEFRKYFQPFENGFIVVILVVVCVHFVAL